MKMTSWNEVNLKEESNIKAESDVKKRNHPENFLESILSKNLFNKNFVKKILANKIC